MNIINQLSLQPVYINMQLQLFLYSLYLGPPSSVGNLTAVEQQDHCSILIQWNPPYLLPGLSVTYKVYINGEIIQDDISTTNYTYFLVDNGLYNVTVTNFYDTLTGNPAVISYHHMHMRGILYIIKSII